MLLRIIVIGALLFFAFRFTGAFFGGMSDALRLTFGWMFP